MSLTYTDECARLVIENVEPIIKATEVLDDMDHKLIVKIISILKRYIDKEDGWWAEPHEKNDDLIFGNENLPKRSDDYKGAYKQDKKYKVKYKLCFFGEDEHWISCLTAGRICLQLEIDNITPKIQKKIALFYDVYGEELPYVKKENGTLVIPLQKDSIRDLQSQWQDKDWNGPELETVVKEAFDNLKKAHEYINNKKKSPLKKSRAFV